MAATRSGNRPNPNKPPDPRGTPGCLIAFILPFCVASIYCASRAVKDLLGGDPDWEKVAALGVGAVLIGGVAIGLLCRGLITHRQALLQAELRIRFPECPWLWRPDWAEGRVESASRSGSAGAWLVAGLLTVLGSWPAFAFREEFIEKGNQLFLLVLAFPLLGLYLLLLAARGSLRRLKFGRCVVELETVPGVLGGRLTGSVRSGKRIESAEGFQLSLSCLEKSAPQSGEESSIEKVLWQDETEARSDESWEARGEPGTSIPFSFHLPPTLKASGLAGGRITTWRLRVRARVAGVDYEDVFEVPIFRTAMSGQEADQPSSREVEVRTESEWVELARKAGIEFNSLANGGRELFFAPGSSPGAALKLTVFTVIWTGALWLQIGLGAPFIFPLLTGLIDLLLVYVCLDLWTGCLRVQAGAAGLKVESRILGIGSARSVAAGDIAAIRPKISMQVGETVYYDLEIVLDQKQPAEETRLRERKLIAGKGIRDKRLAEWLAAELEEAAGVRRVEAVETR